MAPPVIGPRARRRRSVSSLSPKKGWPVGDVDRLPPHDLQAELSVLGSIGLDNACLTGVRGILHVADFYAPDHQIIFQAMIDMADAGTPIDLVTLSARLTVAGQLERVGGSDYLIDIQVKTPSAANVDHYAAIVSEKAARRREIAAATHVMHLAYDGTSTPEERAEAIRALAEAGQIPSNDFNLTAECLATDDELFGTGHGAGWTTGNETLDDVTGGFLSGQCWTIGGRSQQCKTATALNMVLGTMQGGGRVCLFRYEEREHAVYPKLTALVCGIPYSRIRTADIDQQTTFRQTLRHLGETFAGLLRVEQGRKLPDVEAIIDKERPALVIYDTLQAMVEQCKTKEGTDRRDLEFSGLTSFIQRSAKKYAHAAVMISQVLKGTRGLPEVGHLAESAAMERDSDTILLLWWHWTESKNMEHQRELIINVAKTRETGFKGVIGLDIDPGTQKLGTRLDQSKVDVLL